MRMHCMMCGCALAVTRSAFAARIASFIRWRGRGPAGQLLFFGPVCSECRRDYRRWLG